MSNNEILQLFEACDFDGELTENNFEEKILSHLPKDFKYNYEYGATKLVFLISDLNYVIKIPFTGDVEEIYNADEDGYEDIYCPFECAGESGEAEWDYCKVESERFILAREEDIDAYFAKTERIGFISGHPIYIQERAEVFSEMKNWSSYPEEKRSSTREKCSKENFWCFNECWLTDLLEYCGEKTFDKFMSFIKVNHFDDLHSSNIGYINKRPVLIDYSGFAD